MENTQKKVVDFEERAREKDKEVERMKERIKQVEKDLINAREDKKKVAAQLKQFMFQQGELELEVKALKTKYSAETDALEKIEPSFSTLKKLRRALEEKHIQGYRGLLIDFIEYNQQFAACIDLAGKSKLFSIIVDDLESAKQVLALNTEMKLGVITIYPLSLLEQNQEKQRRYPQDQSCHPLYKCLSLKPEADPRLAKLIYNLFSKVVLVKNYPLAMDIAKDYELTCVTPDLQIVYAGAFITKVGHYNKAQGDRVTLYRKVNAIEDQIKNKINQAMQLER